MSKVFLSYSKRDERDAAILCDDLRRRGLDVWWLWEVEPGRNWAAEMGQALEQSDSMVVLVSPEAMASESVQRELDFAIFNQKFEDRVFPVIIRPTRNVPAYFRILQVTDLTVDRKRGLATLVQAIKTRRKAPTKERSRFVVRAGSLKKVKASS